jgi:hypothetical protein
LLPGVAGIRPAPAQPTLQESEENDRSNGQAIRQEADGEEEKKIGGCESSEDWEEVDGETIEEVRADGDVVGPTDSELQEWHPSCCFFFDAKSADGSMEGCVEYMHSSFQILSTLQTHMACSATLASRSVNLHK